MYNSSADSEIVQDSRGVRVIFQWSSPQFIHQFDWIKTVDFGFGGKTGHVFCLLICNPSFVILSL